MRDMAAGLISAIQERCNELRDVYIPAYEEIGPAGNFGLIVIKAGIRAAEDAVASGDVVEMVRMLQELREIKL
jgi:hypothetical protein